MDDAAIKCNPIGGELQKAGQGIRCFGPTVSTGWHAGGRFQTRFSVKLQLDRVDGMVMTEKDPQKLDRLASAQARLAEQERIMSGRPLPGSMRPRPDRRQAPAPLPGPID